MEDELVSYTTNSKQGSNIDVVWVNIVESMHPKNAFKHIFQIQCLLVINNYF